MKPPCSRPMSEEEAKAWRRANAAVIAKLDEEQPRLARDLFVALGPEE